MQRFDIYFSGKLLDGADPAGARSALGRLFKLEGEALERLFSGDQMRIKKSVDVDTASHFRASFRKVGALVDIVPSGQPTPQPRSEKRTDKAPVTPSRTIPSTVPVAADNQVADGPEMTLSPPRSGSLEDCAETVIAPPLPNTDWMALDLPGTTVDQTPPSPLAHIDTSALSMSEANSGSLADYNSDIPPQPIGDISWMALDSLDGPVDQSPPPPPADIATDNLQLSAANAGSLEDCAETKPVQPLPDINHLGLDDDPEPTG